MTDASRMDKDALREMLGNPDVHIIDLRSEEQWNESSTKIKGAAHEDRNNVSAWADRYDRNETLILYCA
ncbi:MAG: rhodanese-like domain-containing protein [Acidobacteriota bacterium]